MAKTAKHRVTVDFMNPKFTFAWINANQNFHGNVFCALAKLKTLLLFFAPNGLKVKLYIVVDGTTNSFRVNKHLRQKLKKKPAYERIKVALSDGKMPQLADYCKCIQTH